MSDYSSQTITVSSCQSDISNQCRIKTPCITGMAEKSNPRLGGGGGLDKARTLPAKTRQIVSFMWTVSGRKSSTLPFPSHRHCAAHAARATDTRNRHGICSVGDADSCRSATVAEAERFIPPFALLMCPCGPRGKRAATLCNGCHGTGHGVRGPSHATRGTGAVPQTPAPRPESQNVWVWPAAEQSGGGGGVPAPPPPRCA